MGVCVHMRWYVLDLKIFVEPFEELGCVFGMHK